MKKGIRFCSDALLFFSDTFLMDTQILKYSPLPLGGGGVGRGNFAIASFFPAIVVLVAPILGILLLAILRRCNPPDLFLFQIPLYGSLSRPFSFLGSGFLNCRGG